MPVIVIWLSWQCLSQENHISFFFFLVLEVDFGSYAVLSCSGQLSPNLWRFMFRHLLSGVSYSFTPDTWWVVTRIFTHSSCWTHSHDWNTHFLRFLLFTQLRKYSASSQRVKMIIMFQNSNYFLIYSNIIVQCIFWFILLKHFRDRP